MIVREKIGRFTQQLPYLPAALRLVWHATPRYTALWAVLLVVQGLLPVATVYLTRSTVDSLTAAFANPTTLPQALLNVALLAAVLLVTELLRGVNRWVQTAQSEYVTNHVKKQIHQQAIALDLSYYETPAYYDMLHRARVDATTMPLSLVQNLGRLGQNGLTLAAMMGVLLPFGVWIPFALLFGTLPAVIVVLRVNRRLHRWQHERAMLRRQVNYYDRLLTTQQSAAELRLFGLGQLFIGRFQTALTQLREERLNLVRQESLAELFAAGLGLVTIGATLAVLTWQTVNGGGSLGDLALFYQAFSQGQRLATTLLSSVGQIYRNLLFLENLFDFLALEPRLPEPMVETVETAVSFQNAISFNNVSFHYPSSQQQALNNFSLTIPQGKIVAIVGENGAGKSTLIKLLTRLYEPTAGSITLDGQDIRRLPLAGLRRLFTVLFQVPVRYEQSVFENVALGDWWAEPDVERVETAVLAAGAAAPITKLPNGLDTILGKRFGGAELSVGEWQRVALARAFLRQAKVIILDEPTSAMDSWAEAAWLGRFRELVGTAASAGKTAVVITHRFTTAMQADIIHVMVGGQIVESGSHEELLAQKGMYARSWAKQMKTQK